MLLISVLVTGESSIPYELAKDLCGRFTLRSSSKPCRAVLLFFSLMNDTDSISWQKLPRKKRRTV